MRTQDRSMQTMSRTAHLPTAVLLLQQPAQLGLDAVLRVIVQLTPELQESHGELVVPRHVVALGLCRALAGLRT